MRKIKLLILIVVLGCSQQAEPDKNSPLYGDWQFLDKFGNYNEAFFSDTAYQTINRYVNKDLTFRYEVRNDSLYSAGRKGKEGLSPVAEVKCLGPDKVVLHAALASDTLFRIKDEKATISSTDPFVDSLTYFTAFYKRYDKFLVFKGILTEEEVKKFREKGNVPEDVLEKKQGN